MNNPEKTTVAFQSATAGHDLLWESLRSGNIRAYERVFQLYYPVLFRYGIKFSRTEDEVKDCIQSLFLQIWERRSFLGPTTSVKNYLLASLRRLLHKNSDSQDTSLSLTTHDFQVELSAESKLIAKQTEIGRMELVRKAFENLPPRQKEAIYLRFYDDQDFNEIANIMGITVRASYKLIYKGLDAMQRQLADRSVDLSILLSLLFSLLCTI